MVTITPNLYSRYNNWTLFDAFDLPEKTYHNERIVATKVFPFLFFYQEKSSCGTCSSPNLVSTKE
jgi:hypothetical protein